MSNTYDLEVMCQMLCHVASEAGGFVREERRNFSASKIESKGVHNYVSYVDKEAERLIVSLLEEAYPQIGFITEEATVEQTDGRYKFVIDPLDGTTNYIHGLSPYCVSIGYLVDEKPLAGVVYIIESDECFYAWKNGGAWVNKQRIHVSPTLRLSDSLVITGFPSRNFDTLDAELSLAGQLMQHTHGLRRFGSAAADLCYVACGRSEAFYESGLSSWDVAAGVVIVEEAGGCVTDYADNANYVYGKQIIASNGRVHEQLRELINAHL